MQKRSSISVVLPAYNESGRIGRTIEEVSDYFSAHESLSLREIIVVDDGSSDATCDVLIAAKKRYPPLVVVRHDRNRGKGAAVRKGVLEASGGLVLFTDVDLSTPLKDVERLLAKIEEGCDIAIGSRALRESRLLKKQPFYRELSGRLFNLFVQSFFLRGFWDTQCGFKLFKSAPAKSIFRSARISGFAFDVEFLYLAKKSGCRIAEVPVDWVNDPDSKVRMFRDPFLMLKDLAKLYARVLLGRPPAIPEQEREEVPAVGTAPK